MKKYLLRALLAAVVLCLLSVGVLAAKEPSFSFELSAEGSREITVSTGDIITVTLTLRRTDKSQDFTMYAMQDELCYDQTSFRLVESEGTAAPGVMTRDIGLRDHRRAYYMNYLSLSGGNSWAAETLVGSFQLEVIGTTGVSRIVHENYKVSRPDGSGSYAVSAEDVTIIISEQCAVTFVSSGGSHIAAQTVDRGKMVSRPADPSRPGYLFGGWYADVDCTVPWDFNQNTVTENLHLYAKWIKDQRAPQYVDVLPGDWFFDDVAYVSANGLMDGVGQGRFAPYVNTNRAMIVTILWRLEGTPAVNSTLTFRDVPAGQWYTEAIRWAAEKEIVTGYSAERFGPNDGITREQMAAILYRYARYKGYDVSARADLGLFTDANMVNAWAAEGLSWANAKGLITGMPNQTLAPRSSATRCQTAAILHRFIENIR